MDEDLEAELYEAEIMLRIKLNRLLKERAEDTCRRVFTYAHLNGVSTVPCTQYDGQDSLMVDGVCSICGDPHE